ncbi:guanylate kinase [Nocardioides luteus]|uniref:AAA family ATPase n=1 Tax=Nocardioides luteus TaxID=1844 RepID=UPI002863D5B3|nr:AAA family ATPase [Nocardioides luteus]MDR7313611.1 guanylate kinase [Nocardioides luteus]
MQRGVILYGPPAAGKDTIDAALRQVSPEYIHFERLKVGPGRTAGYRLVDAGAVQTLRERGGIVWENRRYGATYVVDEPGLLDALTRGVPIIHLGQPAAVDALLAIEAPVSWTVVALTCPEPIALERLRARGSHDLDERLDAWRETSNLPTADVRIDTSETAPDEAARRIDRVVRQVS